MSPLASVVVNNFNYAPFLGAAIDSALAQTYSPVEIVVVDDGSTDGSRELLESYGNRIKRVLKQNGGMASALNAGFAASSGEIVIFLDSDDVLLPTAVAAAAELLRDPQVAKVHWHLREIDGGDMETGRLVPEVNLPEGNLRDLLIAKGPMSGNGSPTSGNAWSRRFLERVLPMPEQELRQHADAYLNTLAPLFGGLRKVPAPQGQYRVHGANDYATQPRIDRLKRNLQMYHYRCRLLSGYLRASGINVQPVAWKTGNPYYHHVERRVAAFHEIEALVPAGETFILVDEGTCGPGRMIAEREYMRFPSGPDEPRGRPVNDAVAIQELERMRAAGAGFVVFVKPALWWLQRYRGLHRHLATCYSCELETDLSIGFNLRA